MFKLTVKDTNKLLSYVDKNFTYDWKRMKREGINTTFDFLGLCKDENREKQVAIERLSAKAIYLAIKINNVYVYQKIAKDYEEIKVFKSMILCLG